MEARSDFPKGSDTRPLRGIKVIDLTGGISGPFCTMLLGDLGADVIKVEKPPAGDDFRSASPVIKGESYYFILANRNKRSLGLDLKSEEGKEILWKLVRSADVLVENYRPSTADNLGLDRNSLREINPEIIHCSITGFGQTGPDKERAAFDLIIQAMCGLMSVTGENSPTLVGTPIADVVSGLYSAYAILAALQERNRSGLGQDIDVSMLDSMLSMMISAVAQYLGTGIPPTTGYRTKIIVPFGIFRAKDGDFVLEAASDGTWQRLCSALGIDEMARDDRFKTIQDRVANRNALITTLASVFIKSTVEECLKKLGDSGVPCGRILDVAAALNYEQVVSRGLVQNVLHPTLGEIKLVGPAVKFSKTPARVSLPPPRLGENNSDILLSLGLSQEEIATLVKNSVVFDSATSG